MFFVLIFFVPERHGVVDPVLARAAVAAEAALDGGRHHVEPEMLVEAVGGDLVLPAFAVAVQRPWGSSRGPCAWSPRELDRQDPGRGHRLAVPLQAVLLLRLDHDRLFTGTPPTSAAGSTSSGRNWRGAAETGSRAGRARPFRGGAGVDAGQQDCAERQRRRPGRSEKTVFVQFQ